MTLRFVRLQSKYWRTILLGMALLLSGVFLFFSNYLVTELSRSELQEVKTIANAFQMINQPMEDYSEVLSTIHNAKIPLIVVNEKNKIYSVKNLDSTRYGDTLYLRNQLRMMKFYNDPIRIRVSKGVFHEIYYKEQQAITLLRYFPYVQLLILFIFLYISFVAYRSSTRFEQNKVWVGMAKETAHQIGTPLSSLMAWVEYLRSESSQPVSGEIISEIEKDVHRLEVITERFSKIGSQTELKPAIIQKVVGDNIDYLRTRLPKTVNITIDDRTAGPISLAMNKNLIGWVIENLVKNATDAMAGKGEITIYLTAGKKSVYIDISDTGKGILPAHIKQIFKPGFTTRKRGWGLGLSLSKRIIEQYHKGKISVLHTEAGVGTTFRIRLKLT